jgi:hypothetical protein
MRHEHLLIATREELYERYKDKQGVGSLSIESQLAQYSHEYPKNFGCIFFWEKGHVNKEFFLIIESL